MREKHASRRTRRKRVRGERIRAQAKGAVDVIAFTLRILIVSEMAMLRQPLGQRGTSGIAEGVVGTGTSQLRNSVPSRNTEITDPLHPHTTVRRSSIDRRRQSPAGPFETSS